MWEATPHRTGRGLEVGCPWTTPLTQCPATTIMVHLGATMTTAQVLHLRLMQASPGEFTWTIATGTTLSSYSSWAYKFQILADTFLMVSDFISTSRPVHPDGYRTLDPNYRSHSRNQLDPYAAQPQVYSTIPVSLTSLLSVFHDSYFLVCFTAANLDLQFGCKSQG